MFYSFQLCHHHLFKLNKQIRSKRFRRMLRSQMQTQDMTPADVTAYCLRWHIHERRRKNVMTEIYDCVHCVRVLSYYKMTSVGKSFKRKGDHVIINRVCDQLPNLTSAAIYSSCRSWWSRHQVTVTWIMRAKTKLADVDGRKHQEEGRDPLSLVQLMGEPVPRH